MKVFTPRHLATLSKGAEENILPWFMNAFSKRAIILKERIANSFIKTSPLRKGRQILYGRVILVERVFIHHKKQHQKSECSCMDWLADFNIYCSTVDLLFICRLVTGHMMIYCCHRFWGKGSTVIYSLPGFTVHMWIYYSHGLIGHIWIYCSHRLTVHLVFKFTCGFCSSHGFEFTWICSSHGFAVNMDLSSHGYAVLMDLSSHVFAVHMCLLFTWLNNLDSQPRWLSWMRVRLETRRSRVRPPPRLATFFREDWSGNIFYGHSLPSADSRRAVVSFWWKNVHNTG